MVKEKKMAGGPKAAKKLTKKPPSSTAGGSSAAAAAPVNWTRSSATKTTLQTFVNRGELPPQDEIHWRAPGEETRPTPEKGEIVVLLDHVSRGLRPPGSLFFRQVFQYYGLTPMDVAPNSILNISNYVVFCEDYLQIPPSLDFFLEIFYCNPSRKNQPLGPYGGVSIQRRKECNFPALALASHPKGWQNTYFYCKDTSPEADEAKFPAFRNSPLVYTSKMNSYADLGKREALEGLHCRARALLAHGLRGTDLVKCWIGWFIQPLSIRTRLFHEYTEETTDNMRYSEITLLEDQVVKNAKRLLGEKKTAIAENGLAPFSTKNKPPTVKLVFSCLCKS